MKITYENAHALVSNPWNPNVVDPINMDKLRTSLSEDGLQKAILIRTLPDGSKQILDGQHRVAAAVSLGWAEVACIDLGEIPDETAKKHTLIGNARYGDDDPLLMANLLSDQSLTAENLLATLPFDEATLTSYFEHSRLDLDALAEELNDLPGTGALDLDVPQGKTARTHQILRFKVAVSDAVELADLITRTKHEQGFTASDDLTNAGDALIYLLGAERHASNDT